MIRPLLLAAAAAVLLAGSVHAQPPGEAGRDGPRYGDYDRRGDDDRRGGDDRRGDRDAGRDRGRPSITLFNGPDFRGRPFQTSSEITNLPKQDNDRAMSLRIDGRRPWQVCTNSDFKGRCQVFDHDVPDLRQFGLAGQISSMRPVR
jgi:hypothetical protein